MGIGLKQALSGREPAFKGTSARRRDGDGVDIEFLGQFTDPLLDEMRRTKHRKAVDQATIEHFTDDQPGFNCLPDANVISDQQPHDRQLQRHHQRHELISARLDAKMGGAAEGARAATKRQTQRIRQQTGAVLGIPSPWCGWRKPRRFHWGRLKRERYPLRVGLRS